MTRIVILATALVLVGCTPESGLSTSPVEGGSFPFVRTCGTATSGRPDMRDAVRIGPLTLLGTAQALPPSTFEPHEGRFRAIQVILLVRGSDDVTVTVPLRVRDSLFLLFDPDMRGNGRRFPVAAGDAQVRFEACGGTGALYDGALLATAPGCTALAVESEGSGPTTGWFHLGDGPRCSRDQEEVATARGDRTP